MLRTTLSVLAGLALLAWAAPAAAAADYPTRPVTLVVAFPPGGASDVLARILGRKLEQVLAQPFVIDNRPGAGGNVAAEAVAHAAPDGYTLLAGNNAILATNAALYKKINFDPVADFAPVGLIGSQANILVVNPALPVKSLAELIALAKAQPGKLNFASGGVGTTPHMAGELFRLTAGINVVHVAYRGEAPAINDLLGGQLHFIIANLSAVIGNVKAGTLRALAVASAQRVAVVPDIPTIAETALPGFEAATWFALVAPKDTPRDIVLRLNTEVQRLLAQADSQRRFADLGMTSEGSTPEALDATIKSEIAKWSKVIKDADIRPQD
jgi:tripartite-type tricarboxylate transporter receptor subunit TctC